MLGQVDVKFRVKISTGKEKLVSNKYIAVICEQGLPLSKTW